MATAKTQQPERAVIYSKFRQVFPGQQGHSGIVLEPGRNEFDPTVLSDSQRRKIGLYIEKGIMSTEAFEASKPARVDLPPDPKGNPGAGPDQKDPPDADGKKDADGK